MIVSAESLFKELGMGCEAVIKCVVSVAGGFRLEVGLG